MRTDVKRREFWEWRDHTPLEADLSQSQAAYRTLTEQHEALVGTYHQLFLASQKTAQASLPGHTSTAPAA